MKTVEAYFDFASPWAYLAHAIAKQRLPGVAIAWKPIYLRGLETFAKGMPYTGSKLAYQMRDLQRCAEHEGVPLRPPATFPLDGLIALRGAIVAESDAYVDAIFRAAWTEARDISDKSVVAAIFAETTKEDISAIASQPVKDALRQGTEDAQNRGVFGVPTFFVGDEMFWGHDRLDYVARAAAR
jgi:2-hydroxychromene-2-carboxylate isomerase